jgi:hypothetical protein
MADTPPPAAEADKTPTIVKMARAVHELITGKKKGDVIAPGEFITETVAKKHSLDNDAIASLVTSGGVEFVDVHKG